MMKMSEFCEDMAAVLILSIALAAELICFLIGLAY